MRILVTFTALVLRTRDGVPAVCGCSDEAADHDIRSTACRCSPPPTPPLPTLLAWTLLMAPELIPATVPTMFWNFGPGDAHIVEVQVADGGAGAEDGEQPDRPGCGCNCRIADCVIYA